MVDILSLCKGASVFVPELRPLAPEIVAGIASARKIRETLAPALTRIEESVAQIAAKIQQARLRYVLVAGLDAWCFNSKDNRVQHAETARLASPG